MTLFLWLLRTITFDIVIIFCMVLCINIRSTTERLKIFPHFSENLEEFYLQVRESNKSYDEVETVEDPNIRSRICKNILSSTHMLKIGVEPVRIDKWYYFLQLRIIIPHLLKDETYDGQTEWTTSFKFPSKERNIYLQLLKKEVTEHAFICIGRNELTYVPYYVSKEYNMNLKSEFYAARVPGRFIFEKIPMGFDKMKVVFMAKEPASVVEALRDRVEDFYLIARRNENTDKIEDNAICKLDMSAQNEICWSILNSSYFDDKIRYILPKENPKCVSKNVFIKKCGSPRAQWMIFCPVVALKDNVDSIFFVSPDGQYVCGQRCFLQPYEVTLKNNT